MIIFETPNFTIEAPDKPHIDRNDGGHIIISPKIPVEDRTKLSPSFAKELIKLTMVAGEAMKKVMNKHSVDIARINYQDNGNWKPMLHIHVYGRAKSAKIQKFGQALHFPKPETGFYDNNKPLTRKDSTVIRSEIKRLLQTEKYARF